MQIKPSENNKLYEMDKYFYEIINLYEHHKMPNKILLSGKKGIGKSTLAYHIVNYILSKDEDNSYDKKNLIINNENKSFKLLINKSHPNFYLIDLVDEKKNIDVAQVRKMISFTNKSSFPFPSHHQLIIHHITALCQYRFLCLVNTNKHLSAARA